MLDNPFIYTLYALLIICSTAWFLVPVSAIQVEKNRFQSIDGLRGYLAFFVFLHHGAYWRMYLQKGQWIAPDSRLYAGIGTASVMLFFMISGFLFFSKLHTSRGQVIHWNHFYKSRILRLFPVYLLTIGLFFLVILFLSTGIRTDSVPAILQQCLQWATFTLYGAPYINQVPDSLLILAGVTWTLVYEWIFYLMLPFIGFLFFRIKTKKLSVILYTIFSVSILLSNSINYLYLVAFATGLPAVYLVNNPRISKLAQRKISSIFIVSCFIVSVYLIKELPWLSLLLLSVVFFVVALGNELFGLLTKPVSQLIGQCTYSMYLFHGLLLYVVFKFIIGFEKAQSFTDLQYGGIVLACIPPLVGLCLIVYRTIESPVINTHKKLPKSTEDQSFQKKDIVSVPL